jgi:hypothetical protein
MHGHICPWAQSVLFLPTLNDHEYSNGACSL